MYVHLSIIQVLMETMKNLLRVALDRGISSIAIPSLGAGKLGYPHQMVAVTLFSEVLLFNQKHPSCIKKFLFVLAENSVYESFIKVYTQQLCETGSHAAEVINDIVFFELCICICVCAHVRCISLPPHTHTRARACVDAHTRMHTTSFLFFDVCYPLQEQSNEDRLGVLMIVRIFVEHVQTGSVKPPFTSCTLHCSMFQ